MISSEQVNNLNSTEIIVEASSDELGKISPEVPLVENNLEMSAINNEEIVTDQKGTNSEINLSSVNLSSVNLPAALCDEKLLQEIQSIPEKMGFKIGEVADLLGIKQYVLRYWETEFDVLKPRKAINNQRYYTKKDVENAFLIRKLLHRDRFSIEGARSAMKELKSFVKVEVKKEKDWQGFQAKLDSVENRVDHLMMGFSRLRQLLA